MSDHFKIGKAITRDISDDKLWLGIGHVYRNGWYILIFLETLDKLSGQPPENVIKLKIYRVKKLN